jgi:hypothetical protein
MADQLHIDSNPLDRFMWSIGDRYHDWWTNRGDIDCYKKCGAWEGLPHMVHYGLICESVKAFHKYNNLRTTSTFFNKLMNTVINNTNGPNTNGSEWHIGELSKHAKITLGYLKGVHDIEDDILEKYTDNIRKKNEDINTAIKNINDRNIVDAVKQYKTICKSMVGTYHSANNKWFAVVCDAGIGPLCTLFEKIIRHLVSDINIVGQIHRKCQEKSMHVMYMIQTPQTTADSANNMAFIPCLTLFRFPITHNRGGIPIINCDNVSIDYPPKDPSKNNLEYSRGYFECKFNYFSNYDGYTIRFENIRTNTSIGANIANNFAYNIYKQGIPMRIFGIPYGRNGSGYRYKGPSLNELLLHYVRLNLSSPTDNIYNTSINTNRKSNPFAKLYYNETDYVVDDIPVGNTEIVGMAGQYSTTPYHIFDQLLMHDLHRDEHKENVQINRNQVFVNDDIPKILNSVDSALGLLGTIDNSPYKGSIDNMTYKPTKPNSLANIHNYNRLPAKIMIDIKHEGDASQVLAAQLLNKTTEFCGRIVFISKDRSCVAHSANIGLPTIKYGNNLVLYNYKDSSSSSSSLSKPKKPPIKRARTNGGGYNESNESNECNVECLDVERVMLTIGMHASSYLLLYKDSKININDPMHMNLVNDLYDDVHDIYSEYHRNLENDITDIDVRYGDDMKTFMNIVHNLYYKINTKSYLKILIDLSNIYNHYYNQPIITFSDNKIKVSNRQNVSNMQNVSNNTRKNNRRNNRLKNKNEIAELLNIIKSNTNLQEQIGNINRNSNVSRFISNTLKNRNKRKTLIEILKNTNKRKNLIEILKNTNKRKNLIKTLKNTTPMPNNGILGY